MKRLICLLVALGIVVSTAGCVNPMVGLVSVLDENNGVVSFFEGIEKIVPPPTFVKSYLETTTIGTGEDKDIFDFEDCDWDVQKYSTIGSYNTRSDKGWFITLNVNDVINPGYVSETPSYAYVGHGNHKLYDELHGVSGYYTPSSLRIQMYGGKAEGYTTGGDYINWDSGMVFRVNSPLFVMKENYVTSYMYFEKWLPASGSSYGFMGMFPPKIIVKIQLIDATSGGVIASNTYSYITIQSGDYIGVQTDTLSNMAGMWRPVILNGSAYKGRTVFLRFDVDAYSGSRIYPYAGYMGSGYSYDVYFDEIHFSDQYGDYITYTQSVPPVPNFSYTTNNNIITCDGTISTDNGIITNYRWEWGDGGVSVGPTASHTYSASGTYQVRLSVTDDEQLTNTLTKSISITMPPPPDTDKDGVPDSLDQCPTVAGVVSNNGCPNPDYLDDDGDGVINLFDRCRTTPGPTSNYGCPIPVPVDTDGDGVADTEDSCPTVVGPATNKGCPVPAVTDTDGDGVADTVDQCKTQAGPASNNGCPIPTQIDSDGDGVIDSEDNCPYEIGSSLTKGCPSVKNEDDDNDGIPNSEDDCPYQAGDASNNGCPYTPQPTANNPPTVPTTTTNTTSNNASTNAFPYWGFFVFCVIVVGFFGVLFYAIKRPKLKGLGRKVKRK